MRVTPRMVMAWVASAVVGATVIAALVVLGSPGEQRARRFDDRRRDDLREIAAAVDLYYTREGRLPDSLEALPPELGPAPSARDPESGEAYEYERGSDDRYRLCATFTRESERGRWGAERAFWSHGTGRHCFDLAAKRIER